MLKQLLITYLCAWFLVPPQLWTEVVYAQEAPAAKPVAAATKKPAGKSDRERLREALHLATWQLREQVKATIPGATRFWLAEAHALFDPIQHCAPYYKEVPKSGNFKATVELVAAAQTEFAKFFEKRQNSFGKQTSETTFNQPLPDMVFSKETGAACQPIAPLTNRFNDDSGKEPEKVQMQADWLQANANQELLTPYFVGLSRKTEDSPYTDVEARNWIGWMGSIRKFAGLLARYHEINETFGGRRPELPELVVSKSVGTYFKKVLGDAATELTSTKLTAAQKSEVTANQILSSSFAKENTARFVPCGEKRKSCGVGLDPDFKEIPGAFCFCDGKEDNGRLMDEEIILTLQTRDSKDQKRTTHGKYLDSMRRLGIKALFSELATANFFLPTKERVALPDACVNAGDIQDYVSFFNRTNTVQAREIEAEKLANAVEHLERDYLSGAVPAPIPALESAASLYARAHQIISTLILNQGTYLTQQNSGKNEKLQAIQKEQSDSLSRMAAVPIYQRLRESAMEVGDSYASILAYKLRLFAALIQEDFAKVEGDLSSPQKRAVLDNMVRTVVLEALVDFAESYLASLMVDAKEFKVEDLVLAWQQVGKPQWRQALEAPDLKGELAKNARELTDTLFTYPEIRANTSADQKAEELVAAQVKRFAPSMVDAALADIPGARAASEIPTPTGEGWQSPVFHLDPYQQLDYQHLKKGLQHMARGYEKKLVERLEADPRFRDPVWLQRNFHQIVYHPDGKSELVKVESAKVLARAIVEKFIETSEADAAKDFDWSAKSRVAIFEPLKNWLVNSSKDAKKVYEKERKEFSSILFTRYLYPLILNRSKTDEAKWKEHFITTVEQIDKRDIIVPFRNKPVDRAMKIVEAYENNEKAKKAKQQNIAVVQNVIVERVKNDSDINVEKATVTADEGGPSKNFTDYVAKHKDADETKSALRWLIPVKTENKTMLLAFYEGRLQTVVPPLAKDIIGYFGPGKMVYPGEEKLEELADNDDKADDALAGTKNARRELFNAVWGSVGTLTKEGKAFKPTVDKLLVDVLKTLHDEANAKKSQDVLIALFTAEFAKAVKENKWDEAWFTRVSQAGTDLRKAIDTGDANEMAKVFPLWIQLVGLEYQKLSAGLNFAMAALQKEGSGDDFKDKVLPSLILPPFEDFRFALLNYMITLTTPQAAHIYANEPLRNPYEQVSKLSQQLEDLEFSISGDKELKGDDLAEVIKVRSHIKYMIERARHQIAATESLKRVLGVYLPSNTIALNALARLEAGSYQEIWNAYYQDQFLDTFEAADRTKMAMSPSQVLKDLNEVAKAGAGVMDVTFLNAETHLKEIQEYCKAGTDKVGIAAFGWNYRKAVGALVWELVSRPAAYIQYQNNENLDSADVKAVGAAVDKLLRLRGLNRSIKLNTADGWLGNILVIAANLENWMDLPSPVQWCQEISSRAETLEKKLKSHTEELRKKKTLPTILPVTMSREYGELVELTADVLHGPNSTFGPLAKLDENGDVKSAVWFSIGPYVNFYVPEPKKEAASDDKKKEEGPKKDETPKEKQADVVTATKGLVAFARLDLEPMLYQNIAGSEGPSVSAKKFFAAETPEQRIVAVQALSAKDRIQLFAAVKTHMWDLIRNPSPSDQFSPKPKVVPEAPKKDTPKEGSESQPSEPSGTKKAETNPVKPEEKKEEEPKKVEEKKNEPEMASDDSENEPTSTPIESDETKMMAQEEMDADLPTAPAPRPSEVQGPPQEAKKEKKDEALLAVKDKVPAELYALAEKDTQTRVILIQAMKIEAIAAKITKGELKDYLAISNAVRDWPIDQYALSPNVSQELLKDAKKSGQYRNIFKLAMEFPRLKQLVIDGKMKTMNDLRVAYQKSLYLFSASQQPSAEYKLWRDKITRLFVLWTELKQKDPKWGLEASPLFAELSLELFERFFRYLPFQLRGRNVELVEEGVAKVGYFKSLEAFRGLSLNEQARVIDKIRSMYYAEVAAAGEEVFSKERSRIAGLKEFGELPPSTDSVLLEVNPYGEARPISYKKPEGEEVGSAYAKLLLFYAEYFSDASIPALSTAARSIEDWRGHCARRAKDEAPVYTTFYDQYLFSWGPLGQKLNERERFEAWVQSLLSKPEVNAAFELKAGKEVPKWAPKRIWKLSKNLKEFVASEQYKQVTELLGLFDENAKAKPEPHTYPFFLALVNWKTNPKRYGMKPQIANGPDKKPWGQRALENSTALVTGSPNPNQYFPERADGLVPEPSPLMQYHLAGLMKDLVDEMGIDLKKFDAWEAVLDKTADEVHTIVASSKRFGLVGVKSARFANTSVPTINTENSNIGPGFETRFFPIIPSQRSTFMPAESFEEYAGMIDRPATYLRYQINTGDQDHRPLYKQMAAVQTRMVGLAEISSESANKRGSYKENIGNWSKYTFGGNPVIPDGIKDKVVQRAETAGVKGVDGPEVARLILIRERYVDLLEKMSQTVEKYPGEPGKYTQIRGNSILLNVGGFASKTADTVTFGWLTSGGGAAELDRMLKSYASTMGWTGSLVTCKRGPSRRWVANAIWQAGVITQWKVEQGLEKDQIERQRKLLTVIDNYFSEAVQGIEYRKAVKVVTGNIVPRLEKLCSADRLKFTRTDKEFEEVKELIKESNLLYYENLGMFLNEFLPEGAYNKTFRSIMALKAEKEKWRKAVEGVGTAVHIFLTISLVSMFVGRSPMGARFTSTAVGRAVHVGVEIIIGLYFAWELYDQFNEDYWGGQGRVDFLMGNRDTQIEGYLPLMKDEQGFLVDIAQDDLLARQQSAMRWAWRIWMGLIVFQQLSYAQRVLRGGARWVLQRVAPLVPAIGLRYARAKELGLDAKVLTAMPPQEAAERIRIAFLEKIETALGKQATRFDEVFELSPGAAATIRRDVKAQLRALCEELQLNPQSLAPLPLYGSPAKVQRIIKAREEAQSVLDELWAIDQQLMRTRLLDKEDVLFLFAGRDSFYLPGLGHPVYRVMPRGLMFTGLPPALYAMGPGSRTLGKLYRAAQGKTDLSNLVTFNYLAAWREKAHGELVRIAEYFRNDIVRIRADRASEAATQRTEYGRQLRDGEINAQEHERLVELLKVKEAQHTDVEEVLLAMIDTQHPLHSHFRFVGRSQNLSGTVENSTGPVASAVKVEFGASAGRPDHISEQLANYAAEFRSICQNGAISPADVDMISAIARRDYYWLGKEFSRPSRVAADSTAGLDEELRNPGAGSQGNTVPPSTVAETRPPVSSGTEWVNVLKNTPKAGVPSSNVTKKAQEIRAPLIDGEAQGLEFEKCWSYAVREESAASRDYILSLARTRSSSEALGYSYGEKLRNGEFVGDTGLMQQRAYRIAIAYTRDMEIAIETAAALRAKNAQAYFNAFYRVRLRHLERVLGEAPSMATSKGMFGMDPSKTKWTFEELSVGRETAVERGVDAAIAQRGERVLYHSNNSPFLVEDYSRLTEIPVEYFEMKGVLDGLLSARGARFAGRAVEYKHLARLRTLFGGRSLETVGEAENMLAVSRTASPQEIKAAASRLRNELTPRANRTDRTVLKELKQDIPEGEKMYADALKRVDEAEQLLLKPPSAPAGTTPPGPKPGSGPGGPITPPTSPVTPKEPPSAGTTTPVVEKPTGPSSTSGTSTATVDPKNASNTSLLDHPVVSKYISTPETPSLFSRTAGEEVAKLGEQGARLRVITREAELAAENPGYLSSEEAKLARMLHSARVLRDAQAAGALENTTAAFDKFNKVFLNHYVLTPDRVRFWMGLDAVNVFFSSYLNDHDVKHTKWTFKNLTELYNPDGGAYVLLQDQNDRFEHDKLTPAEQVRLFRAFESFNTLTASLTAYVHPENGNLEFGLGFEGMAINGVDGVPLEVLIQEEILSDSKLLAYLLREEKTSGEKRAVKLQALFADRPELDVKALKGKNQITAAEAYRYGLEIQDRLALLKHLKSQKVPVDYLAERMVRARKRLVDAGFTLPELKEGAEEFTERKPIILLPENGFRVDPGSGTPPQPGR